MDQDDTHERRWLHLYRENVREVYAFAVRRAGGDRDLAEDVTQEAFLRGIDAWREGPPEDPRAWLRSVARNLLYNYFRRYRPSSVEPHELDLEGPFEPTTPDASAVLHWGLSRLKDAQARLIEAHHLEGVPTRQIAEELGLSERAVEGRLRRSRLALRRLLTPYISAEEARS